MVVVRAFIIKQSRIRLGFDFASKLWAIGLAFADKVGFGRGFVVLACLHPFVFKDSSHHPAFKDSSQHLASKLKDIFRPFTFPFASPFTFPSSSIKHCK